MSLPPQCEADLLELYTSVEHAWRVASDRSFAHSPAWNTFFGVMREQGRADAIVPELALGWLKTGNPHFVDLAVCRAKELEVQRGVTLDLLVAEVAGLRANAATRSGGPFRIRRAIAKDIAFTLMGLAQICSDDSLAVAASKAARWLANFDPGFGCKASTLEIEYPRRWRRKLTSPHEFEKPMSREEFARDVVIWEGWITPPGEPFDFGEGLRRRWSAAIAAMPMASDRLAGSRR